MIGVVVDSSSQLPPDMAGRLGIDVVPLTVTVDGVDHLEGVDLFADDFYAHWTTEHTPTIETSQPAPGRFAATYQRLAECGATSILSVHVAESMSGTLNSARLAADMATVPVRLVDTGTASFGVACCAWAAAEAIGEGADLDEAEAVASARAAQLRTSFVVGVPQLIDRSGRAVGLDVEDAAGAGVPVLAMSGAELSILVTAEDLDTAVGAMVADALACPPSSAAGLRIAVGTSDVSSRPLAAALTEALSGHVQVAEVVEYRIGPSVGAHTGPGTAGLFVF